MPYTPRIPADPEYLAALGRAHYNFVYLEWIVVSTTVRLRRGDWSAVPRGKPAGDICRGLRRAIEQSASIPPKLHAQLTTFAKMFNESRAARNKLLHAHPYTAVDGAQRVSGGGIEWPPDQVYDAARQFEDAAIFGNDIYHGALAATQL